MASRYRITDSAAKLAYHIKKRTQIHKLFVIYLLKHVFCSDEAVDRDFQLGLYCMSHAACTSGLTYVKTKDIFLLLTQT